MYVWLLKIRLQIILRGGFKCLELQKMYALL
jgi:hypothetical protein